MAAKRSERSALIATFDTPCNTPLAAAQDHLRVRRYLYENRQLTLPDMIRIEVRPAAGEGSWQIQVWECPDE